MAQNGVLSQKQSRALTALMETSSVNEAASATGLGVRALWRWLGEPDFRAAHMKARRQAMSQAITQLQVASGEAVAALRRVINDGAQPASARVSAARVVLEMALRGLELEDLEARLAVLEKTRPANARLHR